MKWRKRKSKKPITGSEDLNEKIAKIRGIPTNRINEFLNPTDEFEENPHTMRNGEEASDVIIKHILQQNNVAVSVDVDADGITSTALAINFLNNYLPYENLKYIYAQRSHGHGIEKQVMIEDYMDKEHIQLVEDNLEILNGTDLLIIPDSSTNSIKGISYLFENYPDLDVVILDHHDINGQYVLDFYEENVDKNVTLVNISHPEEKYKNINLSGVGVVYKVMCLVQEKLHENYGYPEVDMSQYIDLVAVGVYSDMMSMRAMENRYYVNYGLKNMNNIGLVSILESKHKDVKRDTLTSQDIGFTIGPMLNASARLDKIELAVDLLLTINVADARALVKQINNLNEERKNMEKKATDYYSEKVDRGQKIILIVDNESSSGMNGLISNKLAQKLHRPVFILTSYDGKLSGSGRSYGDFDSKSFLNNTGFVRAEGHSQAHGISLEEKDLNNLKDYIQTRMPGLDDIEPIMDYDFEATWEELRDSIGDIMEWNRITANQSFPTIMVRVKDIDMLEGEIIGKNKNTFKATTLSDLELIQFSVDKDYGEDLDMFTSIEALGTLNLNVFYNQWTKQTTRTPQIQMEDYHILD